MKKMPIYAADAVDTSGPNFGFATLKTNEAGDLIIDIALKGIKPDTTYNFSINQYPVVQPPPSLTVSGTLKADAKGRGSASVKVARIAGATDLWISVTSDSEYLRSAAVALN